METENCRFLVIVNDEATRSDLARHLKQLSYDAIIAEDACEALDILSAGEAKDAHAPEFDLAILDLESQKLLELIEADARLCHMPVMMICTVDDIDKAINCIELGAEDYLLTPFNPVLLKARIGAYLDKKQLHDQERSRVELLRMEHDLRIGHQIQADFLPDQDHLPQAPGWEIAARFRPARQVAGDFYDAFPLPGDKIGLVIADVCDKGVGAALFMALSRSLIRAFSKQHRPLGWLDFVGDDHAATAGDMDKLVKRRRILLSAGTSALLAVELTNKYITDNHIEMNMFATTFFGVLDPSTGVLSYVNGGHDPPILVGPDGVVKTRLMPTGPAVDMLPDMDFDIDQITLGPSDLLLAFTDGVPDARNAAGERFTVEGLLVLLEEPFLSVAALLDRIETNVYAHIADADQYDDITMLAVWRTPQA